MLGLVGVICMEKIVQIIEKITDVVGGLLQAWIVFLLMVMVMLEVLARYVLQSPLSLADEWGGYMLVAITFMGLGYTWKEKGHVRVELVVNLLPRQLRHAMRFFTLILASLFCFPLIVGSFQMLQDSLLFESRSGSWLRTPLVYPQSVILIGSILLLLQFVAEIIKAGISFKKQSGETTDGN